MQAMHLGSPEPRRRGVYAEAALRCGGRARVLRGDGRLGMANFLLFNTGNSDLFVLFGKPEVVIS